MKIETTDFHTALRVGDAKNPVRVFERGAIVEVEDKLAKELIAKGKAKEPGKEKGK